MLRKRGSVRLLHHADDEASHPPLLGKGLDRPESLEVTSSGLQPERGSADNPFSGTAEFGASFSSSSSPAAAEGGRAPHIMASRRKASIMLPGSYDGNDFESLDTVVEAPKHRGATAATSFLQFLSEASMASLREAWGEKRISMEQFVEMAEPLIRSSSHAFFDPITGKAVREAWDNEGWTSSTQRAASILAAANNDRITSASSFAALPSTASSCQVKESEVPQPKRRFSRRASNVSIQRFLDGSQEQPVAGGDRRLSSSVMSSSDDALLMEQSVVMVDGWGGVTDDAAATPQTSRVLRATSLAAGTTRRGTIIRGGTMLPRTAAPASSSYANLGNSDVSTYLRNLYVTIDYRRTNRLPWVSMSSFLVDGITGVPFRPTQEHINHRGGDVNGDADQQEDDAVPSAARRGATALSPTRLTKKNDRQRRGKINRRAAGETPASGAASASSLHGDAAVASAEDDGDDSDGKLSDQNDRQDSDDDTFVRNYHFVAEVPVPPAAASAAATTGVSASGGGGGSLMVPPPATSGLPHALADAPLMATPSSTTAHPTVTTSTKARRSQWVLHMVYLPEVDRIMTVSKCAVYFMDPGLLPGGATITSQTFLSGGGAGDDDHLTNKLRRSRPNQTSFDEVVADSRKGLSSSQQPQQVIGSPTANSLTFHVIQNPNRISCALFLAAPFWAVAIIDAHRGVPTLSIWQFQIAPNRPPELLLREPLLPPSTYGTDSCLVTTCLYTKPITEAQRLGLPTGFTHLEFVLWIGTRTGQVMTATLVKDVTNASKPVYRLKSHPKVISSSASHRDVVTELLLMHHSQSVCSSGLDGAVHVFDKHAKHRATLTYHKLGVTSMTYSRDSLTLFTAGHDGLIAAWSENLWHQPSYVLQDMSHPPQGPLVAVRCMAQSNIAVSCDGMGTLRFYDTRDRRVICEKAITDPQLLESGIVRREDLRRDADEGSLFITAAIGSIGTVSRKRAVGGLFTSMIYTGPMHRQLIIGGAHMYVAITAEVFKRNPFSTYDSHRPIVHAELTDAFGVVTASTVEVTMWSLKHGMADTRHRHVCGARVTSVACRASTDVLLAGLVTGEIFALQLSTGTTIRTFSCHDQPIRALSLHPTKSILVSVCSGVDGILCFWNDPNVLRCRPSSSYHHRRNEAAAAAAGTTDATISNEQQRQDAATGLHPMQVLPLLGEPLYASFDPTGRVVAVAMPQRMLFFAQQLMYHRWAEIKTIGHGHTTEMTAFCWLQPPPSTLGTDDDGVACGDGADDDMDNEVGDDEETFRFLAGDSRGYIVIWEIRIDRRHVRSQLRAHRQQQQRLQMTSSCSSNETLPFNPTGTMSAASADLQPDLFSSASSFFQVHEDLPQCTTHQLIHVGNNVSTADRFFAAKRQKLKSLAKREAERQRLRNATRLRSMRGGGADDDDDDDGGVFAAADRNRKQHEGAARTDFGSIVATALKHESLKSDGTVVPTASSSPPPRGSSDAESTTPTVSPLPGITVSKSSMAAPLSLIDDVSTLAGGDADEELRTLLEQHQARQLEVSKHVKDPVVIALAKKARGLQAMHSVLESTQRGLGRGGSDQQDEFNRELEMIRLEAADRERRRQEEEAIILGCSEGGGAPQTVASNAVDAGTSTKPHSRLHAALMAANSSDWAAREALKKRAERRRRLTKAGLLSMTALQQLELTKTSPTFSTMDPQLAFELERQQHDRTQAIKHYHANGGGGVLPVIQGESLLAPAISCVATDPLYPFLIYTGDNAGRLIVWYLGSADPCCCSSNSAEGEQQSGASSSSPLKSSLLFQQAIVGARLPAAAAPRAGASEVQMAQAARQDVMRSWLEAPRPIARSTPHGDRPILSVSCSAVPFHCILSWGTDNCVIMSTWSGIVLGRLEQGPIPDRRWSLGPQLTQFNQRSFTVQLLWMKLRRYVLEGLFHRFAAAAVPADNISGPLIAMPHYDPIDASRRSSGDGLIELQSSGRGVMGRCLSTSELGDHLWRSTRECTTTSGAGASTLSTPPPLPMLISADPPPLEEGGGPRVSPLPSTTNNTSTTPTLLTPSNLKQKSGREEPYSSKGGAVVLLVDHHHDETYTVTPGAAGRRSNTSNATKNNVAAVDWKQLQKLRSHQKPRVRLPVSAILSPSHATATTTSTTSRLVAPSIQSTSPPPPRSATALDRYGATVSPPRTSSPLTTSVAGGNATAAAILQPPEPPEYVIIAAPHDPPVPKPIDPATTVAESTPPHHGIVEGSPSAPPDWSAEATSIFASLLADDTPCVGSAPAVLKPNQAISSTKMEPIIIRTETAATTSSLLPTQQQPIRTLRSVATTRLLPMPITSESTNPTVISHAATTNHPSIQTKLRGVAGDTGEDACRDDVSGGGGVAMLDTMRMMHRRDERLRCTLTKKISSSVAQAAFKKMERFGGALTPPLHPSRDANLIGAALMNKKDQGGGDDGEDEVERAIHELRERRRCVSMMSQAERNKNLHERRHATQAVMRWHLSEIDRIRSSAAMGHTPYYSEQTLNAFPSVLLGGSAEGRIVFSKKAVISQVPPSPSTVAPPQQQ